MNAVKRDSLAIVLSNKLPFAAYCLFLALPTGNDFFRTFNLFHVHGEPVLRFILKNVTDSPSYTRIYFMSLI